MNIPIEQRLAAVEIAVAELQRLLVVQPAATDWLQRFDGAFKDEPAFDEVIAYGRAIRETGDLPEGTGS
jgi:hypothetical protein